MSATLPPPRPGAARSPERHPLPRAAALVGAVTLLAWAAIDPFDDPVAKPAVSEGETDPVMLELDPYLIEAFGGGPKFDQAPLGKDARLADLLADERYQALVRKHELQLFSGPMVGHLRPDGASFWLRTAAPAEVQVMVDGRASQVVRTTVERDFTAVLDVDGLDPFTEYRYAVSVAGHRIDDPSFRFRTAPTAGSAVRFELAFGSGARYIPKHEAIWTTLRERRPLAYFALGDNVYHDLPEHRAAQRVFYYRRQLSGHHRSFLASVAQYAMYDDHDLGRNDCAGGPERFVPEWKYESWKVFRENWCNPAYGGGDELPGCWFATRIGDVELFMLDGRYYRTTKGPEQSMLGPAQLDWLLAALERSDARFKILASGTMWHAQADKGGKDSWQRFAAERDRIFDHLVAHRIGGVVLITGDRHRSDIWRTDHPGMPYPLYEFVSGRMTNIHVHGTRDQAQWSYNKDNLFGLLDFDFTRDDPTVTFRCVLRDGTEVKAFPLRLSELAFQ